MFVSVIIPTFNRAHLISRTIESVIAQSFVDWECLVVDDFSTDETESVIKNYSLWDERICYYQNERNKGACGARNTGLMKSKGKWVLFFDSDNTMHPEMLSSLVNMCSDNIDVVACWSNIVQESLRKKIGIFNWIAEGNIHEAILCGHSYVDTSSGLIRAQKCNEIDGWSEDCPSFQEWDLHIRLSRVALYATVKELLVDYYVGGADTISKDKRREIEGYLYILKKYRKEWKQFPKAYNMYGLRVWDLITQLKNDDIAIKRIRIMFFQLFPITFLRIKLDNYIFRIKVIWNKIKTIWK